MATIVSFHAHPDDEALLTAGTLAKAAAAGHRVVIVTATDGGAGLAAASYGHDQALARHRMAELEASGAAIGAAKVQWLGYADSGLDGQAQPPEVDDRAQATGAGGKQGTTFVAAVTANLDAVAQQLADILRAERADVLTSYDPTGGYGHPDHVAVHRVGRRAAELAGTPRLLEATIDRTLLLRAIRAVGTVYRFPPEFDPTSFERAYTPREQITHVINVRSVIRRKRAAMRAHASQATADTGDRTLAALLRLPLPLFRLALGREWFVEVGQNPDTGKADDVLVRL